jgi:16S rRNA (cytosine967-C5)-methyltransferase
VLGVLRWQIRLDHQFRPLLKRPNAKLDPEILIALRLGAFQLLHWTAFPPTPPSARASSWPSKPAIRFASRMVNAVLRKLSGAPPVHFLEESSAELALAQSHPAWLVERWVNSYGFETARAICRYGQTQPCLSLRIENPEVEAELVQAGIQLAPGQLLTRARTVVSGDITATAAFLEGRVRIQDEGSQLVAEIAASCPAGNPLQESKSILDACAAPGGKTLILAERNPYARILACESSPQRLEQLRSRLAARSGPR